MVGVKEVKPRRIDPYGTSLSGRAAKAIDDAIYLAFPRWGTNRRSTRMRSELLGTQVQKLGVSWTRPDTNRDGKWLVTGYSIDTVLGLDIGELQDRCAELYRTNNVAHAAIEGRVSNEVGTGIKGQSRVRESKGITDKGATLINDALDRQFAVWSKCGVDEKRSQTIFEFQRLANRSLAVFGEALVLLSETPSKSGITLTCECISPERLSTPPEKEGDDLCRLGVQFRASGTIAGYWIRTTHPGELGKSHEYQWEYFPRYDEQGQPRVLHVFEKQFPGQTRGIPWLAAALDRIKDLDDWFEAELIAKQVEACFGLVFTGGDEGASPYDVARSNSSETAGGRQLEELEPGMIHYASKGEEVKTIDPQRPGATFAPFVEQTLRSIAAAINLPYEILSKNFFRTTFSSGQLAMLDGRHGFKTRRQTLIDGLLVPLWARFVNDAVFADEADGTIDIVQYVADPEPFEQCVWVAPGWGFINPRDEVRAATDALASDITTLSTLYAERGEDAEVQMRQRQEEKLQTVRDLMERRQLQWDEETARGLPHAELAGQPVEEDSDDGNQSAEDKTTENEDDEAAVR